MSIVSSLVRVLRFATDPIAPYSFNRMGFELNRRGFELDSRRDGDGRVALVTGANSGIGRATALELARCGFEVWLLCRDAARGTEARDSIARECGGEGRVHLAILDMSSLASIRRFAREFTPRRVDVLVHNAGVLPLEKQLTEDGVELTFATNVLGPFALTALLSERLERSDDARVIFVASGGLYMQRLDLALFDVEAPEFDGTRAYANAKRAQVVLGHLLARRFAPTITFASMHPGWADTVAVRTSLPRFHSMMQGVLRSAEQGADTVVWLATSERVKGTQGSFWFDREIAVEYPLFWTRESNAVREELLRRCEDLSGVILEKKEAA